MSAREFALLACQLYHKHTEEATFEQTNITAAIKFGEDNGLGEITHTPLSWKH